MTVVPGYRLTYTGRLVNVFDLSPEDVNPLDIAHSLANICRYGGHTKEPYSVGEHSVRCARTVGIDHPNRADLLLHDATETYLGDLIAPLKVHPEFAFYSELEERVRIAIAERFGLSLVEPTLVKEVDIKMRMTEMRDLMPPLSRERREGEPDPYGFHIKPWTSAIAKWAMIEEMESLGIEVTK